MHIQVIYIATYICQPVCSVLFCTSYGYGTVHVYYTKSHTNNFVQIQCYVLLAGTQTMTIANQIKFIYNLRF